MEPIHGFGTIGLVEPWFFLFKKYVVRSHNILLTIPTSDLIMRFTTGLHTISEDAIYEETKFYTYMDNSDDSGETGSTGSIRLDSIDDIFPTIQRDRYRTKDISMEPFMKKLSGRGIIVKKRTGRSNGTRYRRLYSMGRYMYLSSFFDTKEIDIDKVGYTKSKGKKLIIETHNHGILNLEMPVVTDALALSRLLK